MDPGAEDSQGPIDPQQIPNDSEKEIGPANSNPEAEVGDVVLPDHLNRSINDKVIELDHLASEQELIEIERKRIVKGCCLDSSDDDEVNEAITNFPED